MAPGETDPRAPASATVLAIVNARVWTGDPRRPWADAVLVRGERVETVGSSAEVRKRANAAVQVLDAKGMMVAPRVVDSHAAGDDGGVAVQLVHARVNGVPPTADATLGMLRAGMSADLVVIDRDLTRLPSASLRDARVVLVMAGGRVVHDPGQLVAT